MKRFSAKTPREKSPFVTLTGIERLCILAVFFTIILLVGIFALSSNRPSMIFIYLAFLSYVLALVFPLLFSVYRALGVFHPIVFYIIWFGLRSLLTGKAVLAARGLEFHNALNGLSGYELNLIVVNSFILETMAVLALYAGFVIMPRLQLLSLPIEKPRSITLKALIWLLLPFIGVLILVNYAGGLGELMMERGLSYDETIKGQIGHHWHLLTKTGTIIPVVWLSFDKFATKKLIFWVVTILALGCVFAGTGSRSSVIIPLIITGAMWVLQHKVIPYKTVFWGVFISIFLLGLLGEFRAATMQSRSIADLEYQAEIFSSVRSASERLVGSFTYDSGQLAILGRVPQQVDHLYGESYLSIPFIFFPRAIWPGETPHAAGKLNAIRIYERPFTGKPAGLVGEAYWNFSWVGPILIFGFYGMLLSLAGQMYLKNQGSAFVSIVYLYFLFLFAPGSNQLYDFIHALVPVIGFYGFVVLSSRVRFGVNPCKLPVSPNKREF